MPETTTTATVADALAALAELHDTVRRIITGVDITRPTPAPTTNSELVEYVTTTAAELRTQVDAWSRGELRLADMVRRLDVDLSRIESVTRLAKVESTEVCLGNVERFLNEGNYDAARQVIATWRLNNTSR